MSTRLTGAASGALRPQTQTLNPQGGNTSDPRDLLRTTIAAGSLETNDDAAAAPASTAAGFWTAVESHGTAVDSNYTADTYKTLYNDTAGRGLAAVIFGPTSGGTQTTTFRITIDGVATTIPAIAVASGSRAVLGSIFCNPVTSTNNYLGMLFGDLDASKSVIAIGSAHVHQFIPIHTAFLLGQVMLRYESSLLIEASHSANITGTGSQERQSGVIHVVQD
tara:strand:+ start:178 stop:840 length:663 start_codon:yes stop_codon:yes gene_type:complete